VALDPVVVVPDDEIDPVGSQYPLAVGKRQRGWDVDDEIEALFETREVLPAVVHDLVGAQRSHVFELARVVHGDDESAVGLGYLNGDAAHTAQALSPALIAKFLTMFTWLVAGTELSFRKP